MHEIFFMYWQWKMECSINNKYIVPHYMFFWHKFRMYLVCLSFDLMTAGLKLRELKHVSVMWSCCPKWFGMIQIASIKERLISCTKSHMINITNISFWEIAHNLKSLFSIITIYFFNYLLNKNPIFLMWFGVQGIQMQQISTHKTSADSTAVMKKHTGKPLWIISNH